jgi:hypothetical protein
MDDWPPRCNHRGDAGVRLRKTGLDHGQHSAFFDFAANHYWCRAGDPYEGKSLGRRAVRSPCHTGASYAAHSPLDSYLAILRQNDINIDIGSSGALTQLPAIRQFD